MSEDPPIVKTDDELRQGTRVKGMTTVLTVSIILSIIAVSVIAVIAASGSK